MSPAVQAFVLTVALLGTLGTVFAFVAHLVWGVHDGLRRSFVASAAACLTIALVGAIPRQAHWSSVCTVTLFVALGVSTVRRRPVAVVIRDLLRWSVGIALVAGGVAVALAMPLLANGTVEYPPVLQDNTHYVVVQAFLESKGIESPVPLELDGLSSHRGPYHYVDLWLATGIRTFLGVHRELALGAVATALLLTTLVLGLAAFIRQMTGAGRASSISAAVAGVCFIVSAPLAVFDSLPVMSGVGTFVMNPVINNKLLVSGVLLVAAMCAGSGARTRGLAPWLFASIGAAHVTMVPFSIGVLALALVNSWRRRSRIDWSVAAAGLALCLSLLLDLRGGGVAGSGRGTQFAVDFAWARTAFNVFAGTAIRTAVLLVPLLPLAAWLRRRRRLRLLAPVGIGSFAGLAAWAIVHRTMDSVQLLSNASSIVLAVLAGLAVGTASRRQRGIGFVAAALAVAQLNWYLWSRRSELEVAYGQSPATTLSRELGTRHALGVHFVRGQELRDVFSSALAVRTHEIALPWLDLPYQIVVPIGRISPLSGRPADTQQASLLRAAPVFQLSGTGPFDDLSPEQIDRLLASQSRLSYAVIDARVELPPILASHLADCVSLSGTSSVRICGWKGSAPAE